MGKLSGLRVIDLSRVLSGPFCTALLADLGAEVIKVESPGGGDDSRRFGPFVRGGSVYFSLINRNKKSVTLNLREPRAQALLAALAKDADVVVENFRPGVAKRLRCDYATLTAANPRLVYLSISGFGQTGPKAGWPAYDLIIQAMSGVMSITGQPDGPPTALGESLADLWTGLLGSWAILAALAARSNTGRGERIDLAMFDAMLALQVTGLAQLEASGRAPSRVGNRHPVTTPVDTFATRDGHVAIVAPSDAHFARFCALIGRPELAGDPRFADNAARRERQAELKTVVELWSRELTSDAVVAACHRVDIPAGPVWDLAQAAGSDQTAARELVRRVPHPEFGVIGIVLQPAKFATEDAVLAAREPRLGEHNEAVLGTRLGLSAAELERLRAEGVI
ncbi:MAG TPA: CoA transferase [Burkholderiales bacterium]|nr:CoA transferase [Burkholderiales bacterium]